MGRLLTELVVGQLDAVRHEGDFNKGMRSIQSSLQKRENELETLWSDKESDRFITFAPACARMLLEQGMATLLGRVDPIRFIAIYKGAQSQDFKMGEQNPSSLKWSEDIIPSTVKSKKDTHWKQEFIRQGLIRSLLDGHLADYIFSGAHDLAKDSIIDEITKYDTLPEYLINFSRKEKGEQVLSEIRQSSKDTYSFLSKGIHFEFFDSGESMPSKDSIAAYIEKTISVIATTAIYVHFSDISINKINDDAIAVSNFIELTKKFSVN